MTIINNPPPPSYKRVSGTDQEGTKPVPPSQSISQDGGHNALLESPKKRLKPAIADRDRTLQDITPTEAAALLKKLEPVLAHNAAKNTSSLLALKTGLELVRDGQDVTERAQIDALKDPLDAVYNCFDIKAKILPNAAKQFAVAIMLTVPSLATRGIG